MPQRKQSKQDPLRHWLDWLLAGGGAHAGFDDAVKDFPPKLRGVRASGLPHTAWQLLEHLRLAQWDILEFSTNPKYKTLSWPDDYWPAADAPGRGEWNKSVQQFRDDRNALRKLVANPRTDLNAQIPWGDGQTLLREALLVADHNAYHIGQLVLVRRALGTWKG